MEFTPEKKGKLPRRFWLSLLLLLIAVPAALLIFSRLGSRYYYLASLVIFALIFLPFFLSFERRRVQARELVVLAVLCALAVAARAAFVWVPHFKPLCAVVILAGVAMGPESGFLVGAVSAFVSNFLYGQGAWTPWQMFSFGVCGFLAGLFYRLGWLKKERIPLTVFGFLVIFLLVGPLLDTSTLFLMTTEVTRSAAAAIYLSGLPVNLIHASAVALFLFFLSVPLLEKLDRIRIKYGMME